jgi:hypothetical protein
LYSITNLRSEQCGGLAFDCFNGAESACTIHFTIGTLVVEPQAKTSQFLSVKNSVHGPHFFTSCATALPYH